MEAFRQFLWYTFIIYYICRIRVKLKITFIGNYLKLFENQKITNYTFSIIFRILRLKYIYA